MASSIFDWSTTAASNSNSDSAITWSDSQAPSSVDDSGRAMMGRAAELVKDLGGALTAGGSANAITITANSAFTTVADGRFLAFRAVSDNTAPTSFNVNGTGAKGIRKVLTTGDTPLTGGEIQAGGIYIVQYNAALNSGAGVWLLLNPSPAPSFGRHNYLINGNFDIWQSGTSFTTSSLNGGYTADQWITSYVAGSALTTTQQAFTVGQGVVPGEPTYFIRLVSTGTTGVIECSQRVEDVRTLAGKTWTLTFWAKIASGTLAFTPFITQNFGSGGSSDVQTNGTAGTLTTTNQKFTSVITMPSISGKTVGTDSYLKVALHSVAATARTVEFSRASLVEGDASAETDAFPARSQQQELALCQRHFLVMSSLNHGWAASLNGQFTYAPLSFPVSMRTTPAATVTAAGTQTNVASVLNDQLTPFGIGRFGSQSTAAGNVSILNRALTFDARL